MMQLNNLNKKKKVFYKENLQILKLIYNLHMMSTNSCGCGRSPTGKCIGWHSLSENEFKEKLAQYEAKKNKKNS